MTRWKQLHHHAAVNNLPNIAAYTFTGHEPRQNTDRYVRPLCLSEESDEDDSEDEELHGLQKLDRDQIRTAIFTSYMTLDCPDPQYCI